MDRTHACMLPGHRPHTPFSHHHPHPLPYYCIGHTEQDMHVHLPTTTTTAHTCACLPPAFAFCTHFIPTIQIIIVIIIIIRRIGVDQDGMPTLMMPPFACSNSHTHTFLLPSLLPLCARNTTSFGWVPLCPLPLPLHTFHTHIWTPFWCLCLPFFYPFSLTLMR